MGKLTSYRRHLLAIWLDLCRNRRRSKIDFHGKRYGSTLNAPFTYGEQDRSFRGCEGIFHRDIMGLDNFRPTSELAGDLRTSI